MDKIVILLIVGGIVTYFYLKSNNRTLGLLNKDIPTHLLAGQSINPITGQIQTVRGIE